MAITREKKEEILAQLKDNFSKATAIYFTEYCGLTVDQVGELRAKLRQNDSEMYVAKKTLIKMAAEDAGYKEIPDEAMAGPIAAVFSYEDQVAAAKTVHDFLKTFEGLGLTGALMDGNVMSKDEAKQLAQLPSREELLAKLVGSMKAPISGFHGILHGVMREFVGVVAAYKDKVEKEGPATEAPAKEEAPKSEEAAPAEEKKEEATPAAAEEKPAEEAKTEEAPKEEA